MSQHGDVAVGSKRPAPFHLPTGAPPTRSKLRRQSAKPPALSKSWKEIAAALATPRASDRSHQPQKTSGGSVTVLRGGGVTTAVPVRPAAGQTPAAVRREPSAERRQRSVTPKDGHGPAAASRQVAVGSQPSHGSTDGISGPGSSGPVRVTPLTSADGEAHPQHQHQQGQPRSTALPGQHQQREQQVTTQQREGQIPRPPCAADGHQPSAQPDRQDQRADGDPPGSRAVAGGGPAGGSAPPADTAVIEAAGAAGQPQTEAQSQLGEEADALPSAPTHPQQQQQQRRQSEGVFVPPEPLPAVPQPVTAEQRPPPQMSEPTVRVKIDPESETPEISAGPGTPPAELRPDGVRECAEMTFAQELVCMRLSPCEVGMVASVRALPDLTQLLHERKLWDFYKELKTADEKARRGEIEKAEAALSERMERLCRILPLTFKLSAALVTESRTLLRSPSSNAVEYAMKVTAQSFKDGLAALQGQVTKGFVTKDAVEKTLKLAERALAGAEQFNGVAKELQAGLVEYSATRKQPLLRGAIVSAIRQICEKVNIPSPTREAVSARDKFSFHQMMTKLQQKITRQIFEIELAREKIWAVRRRCQAAGQLQLPPEVNRAMQEVESLMAADLDWLERGEDQLLEVWGLVRKIVKKYNDAGETAHESAASLQRLLGQPLPGPQQPPAREKPHNSQQQQQMQQQRILQKQQQQMPPPQPRPPAAGPAATATLQPSSSLSTASLPHLAAAEERAAPQAQTATQAIRPGASAPPSSQAQYLPALGRKPEGSRRRSSSPVIDLTVDEEAKGQTPERLQQEPSGARGTVQGPGPVQASEAHPTGHSGRISGDDSAPTIRRAASHDKPSPAARDSSAEPAGQPILPPVQVGAEKALLEDRHRLARRARHEANRRATSAVKGMGLLSRKLGSLLEEVQRADKMKIFREPVKTAIAPDYYDVIKKPICLKDIQEKMKNREYTAKGSIRAAVDSLKDDLELMIKNCLTYNPPTNAYHRFGQEMGQIIQHEFTVLEQSLKQSKLL